MASTLLLILLAASTALSQSSTVSSPTPTTSRYCYIGGPQGLVIESQADATLQLGNCTQLGGNLTISGAYNDPVLSLPGITDIDTLNTDNGVYPYPGQPNSTQVVTIDLPDAVSIHYLYLWDIPALKNLSVPRLQRAINVEIYPESSMGLQFPGLVNVTEMKLAGNISSVDLPSLQEVSGSLNLWTQKPPYYAYLGNPVQMNVNLPALQTANATHLDGQMPNISLPQLTTAGGGLKINNLYKNPDTLSLPSLQAVTGKLDLSGNWTSISLPNLNSTDNISIVANTESIDLSHLSSVQNLYIVANITDQPLPTLHTILGNLTLYTYSSSPLNCTSASSAWSTYTYYHPPSYLTGFHSFTCGTLPPGPAYYAALLDRRIKLGVGIGIPAAALIVVIVVFGESYRRELKRRKTVVRRARELEMVAAERVEWERRSAEARTERELLGDGRMGELERRASQRTLVGDGD